MSAPHSDPAAKIRQLEKRIKLLQQEKASLQLAVDLIERLAGVVGLERVIERFIQILMEGIGGTQLAVHYKVEGSWRYADMVGDHGIGKQPEDPLVLQAISSNNPVRQACSDKLAETMSDIQDRFETWVYPLAVGEHVFGAVRLDGLGIVHVQYQEVLAPFISYASMVLYHEVSQLRRLEDAYQVAERARNEMFEVNQLLTSVVEGSPLAIVAIDTDHCVNLWSPTAEQLFGWSSEEVLGQPIPFVPPEHQEHFEEISKGIIESGERLTNHEVQRLHKNGKRLDVSISTAPIFDSDGDTIGAVALFADLRRRKQAEQALAISEQRYREVVEDIPILLCRFDPELQITFVNRALAEDRGISADDIEARGFLSLFPNELVQSVMDHLKGLSPERPMSTHELKLVKPNGNVYRRRWTTRLILSNDGKLEGFQAIALDITEQRRLEDQLRHTQKMEAIGTLAGGIAHDFNNLLQALFASVELALMEVEEHGEVYSYLCEAQNAAHRAGSLVRQILTFSRRGEQETKAVNLFSVVRETSQLLRATLPATIEIHEDLDASCGAVLADPTQLHQIIMNLGTNAFHAMAESGGVLELKLQRLEVATTSVEVTLVESGPYIDLMVSDSGSGMDAKLLDRIFEPYFTTRKPGEGTGLGLAVVHGIVTSLGGAIIVASAPGAGAQFRILLPRIKAEAETVSGAHKAQPTGSEHVLLVDDEAAILRLGVATLSSLGYKVTTAHSAEEALDLFEQNSEHFDLVLTDQTMPGISGLDLAEKLLPKRPDLPVVLCTGRGAMVDRDRAEKIGVRTILSKPFDRSTLAVTLRRVFAGR